MHTPSSFFISIIDDDPRTIGNTIDLEDSKLHIKGMIGEMDSLDQKEMQDIIELLVGMTPIGSKWVFKKLNTKGKAEK